MKNILIVEDESLTAFLLEIQLKNAGFVVLKIIASGEEAVEFMEHNHPDIILMDIMLVGNMNGIEAAQNINQHYNVPIIFLTGYGDKEIMSNAMKLNPKGYLIKPYDIQDLIKLINSI